MAHQVRAKFKVSEIRRHAAFKQVMGDDGKYTSVPAEAQTVTLLPVYGNGDPAHENTKFWEASPSGKIELSVINEAAWSAFDLGQEMYIDFIPVGA